jgi:spore photoproduct lyase
MALRRNNNKCKLRPRKTKFIEILRTTPAKTVCPNFFILAHANGCLFKPLCDYCYLKSSLWKLGEQPLAFSNVEDMLADAARWIAQDDLESYVLNTGNLSDSLTFEKLRPAVARLVGLFRAQAEAKGRPHALLLLTKGGVSLCRPLLDLKPCRNVIVSFSVNAPQAAEEHEQGAAAVADRLEAARQVRKAGWRLRMRIDPMILGYDYRWIARQVRDLRSERITLGTLRAERNLRQRVNHGLFAALEVPEDPKALARYPAGTRAAMYREVIGILGDACPIGLCEEFADTWKASGLDPESALCNCGQ